MNTSRRSFLAASAAIGLAGWAGAARAQDSWPSKAIRVISPGSPGGGSDIFVFEKAGKWDQIRDFQKGDKIDLSRIDANTDWSGHQDFKFIGSNWLKDAGDLGVYVDRAHNKTYVQANIDRDADFEVSIVLNGVHQLEASDFIL